MYKLLIVEDDAGIAEAVAQHAQQWGLEAHTVTDFRNVMMQFNAVQPQLVLLDITLPFFDGYHWCTEIRKVSNVPIVFLSSAADNMNIMMALNLGADDFIAKPFDLSVLMAKVQALFRRTYDFSTERSVLEHRGAFLDVGTSTLTYNDRRIPLSKNEYRILHCLMENKGRVVSRERLMERLWETDVFVDENTLTVNINRLRRKLDAAGLTGFIATRVGVGYTLAEEEE